VHMVNLMFDRFLIKLICFLPVICLIYQEVYHSQPASSLSSYNEHFSETVASYDNLVTDEMDNLMSSAASDADQLNHIAELEQTINELRACLEKENEEKLRLLYFNIIFQIPVHSM